MKVSKNAHADREYTVKVSSADVTQNVEIFPMGDVNNDGFIIILDATLVQKYLAKVINEDSLALDNANFDSDDIVRINGATAIQKTCKSRLSQTEFIFL
ncbi:MAG: dockerin type I domain-containing protein [Clostridia bacterium]|nr:dockerin type I domain-containing protein [Clostridia bacterium]